MLSVWLKQVNIIIVSEGFCWRHRVSAAACIAGSTEINHAGLSAARCLKMKRWLTSPIPTHFIQILEWFFNGWRVIPHIPKQNHFTAPCRLLVPLHHVEITIGVVAVNHYIFSSIFEHVRRVLMDALCWEPCRNKDEGRDLEEIL